mmetsp:Transcript_77794/g.204272  ORF Transcript_77794/g.204272 Transcript_77794/m.204272 type:complete len:292 (-) Transcript_77794:8051-8926(-)
MGFRPNMMQIASNVRRTPPGGDLREAISRRCALLSFLRHATASSRAGSASSRSRCASSLIACVFSAFMVAPASSSATTLLTSSASALSFAITTIISPTSFWVFSRTGFFSTSISCRPATCSSALSILVSPIAYRDCIMPTCFRLSSRILAKLLRSSRYEVGVTYTYRFVELRNLREACSTLWWIVWNIFKELSKSGNSTAWVFICCFATEYSASAGHSWNQSMVQQFTSDGNMRRRLRKLSPTGENASVTCTFFFTRVRYALNRFAFVGCMPSCWHRFRHAPAIASKSSVA